MGVEVAEGGGGWPAECLGVGLYGLGLGLGGLWCRVRVEVWGMGVYVAEETEV